MGKKVEAVAKHRSHKVKTNWY